MSATEHRPPSEIARADARVAGMEDEAWVEVVNRMDEVYADLIESQVALEQKHSALEDAQSFIDSVLKAMSDILIVCDANGRIQQVNRALEELVGRSMAELLGTPLKSLFSENCPDMLDDLANNHPPGPMTDCEVELIDHKGQPSLMAINCSPRYNQRQRLSGFVITGRPLGELRRAYADLNQAHESLKTTQKQLIQSEKLASLGRLIAGVAHELNNPISFVFGNMHVLQRYGKRFRTYLEAIHSGISKPERDQLRQELKIDRSLNDITSLIEGTQEGAERVSEIVQNLSRFAHPKDRTREPFDVVRLTRTALHWVIKASRHRPEIVFSATDELIITGNEGHVHQILINLIQNAFDAVEVQEESKIMLNIHQSGEHVNIEIRDNGPGIAEADLLRVFDPFFTSKPVGKGTGLGLYISYGLATEQCGGMLQIDNHADGGIQAVLQLPRSDEA